MLIKIFAICWTSYLDMCLSCRVEDKLSVCLKTITPSCILKKKSKLCIYVWTSATLPQSSLIYLKNLSFLNYLKFFVTIPFWQPNELEMMFCNQKSLGRSLPSPVESPFLLESNLFNSNAASRHSLISLFGWYHWQLTEERDYNNMSKGHEA